MVILRIKCGLGNQLFQFAAGQALALRLGTEIRSDIRWFDGANRRRQRVDRRAYLLPALGLETPRATAAEVDAYFPRWWWLWSGGRAQGIVLKQGVDPAIDAFESLTGNVVLDGYWQGERFFEPVKAMLATHLGKLRPQTQDSLTAVEALRQPGVVGVHVRRGDYVRAPSVNRLIVSLPTTYYRDAIRQLGASRAVVFSDDTVWCRQELDLGVPFDCVERPEGVDSSCEDLLSLAQSTRLVISNSTFSWWAGWIATQRGGEVVAPRHWFHDRAYSAWEPLLKVAQWSYL